MFIKIRTIVSAIMHGIARPIEMSRITVSISESTSRRYEPNRNIADINKARPDIVNNTLRMI
ncbi:MAG: hypothetical protein IK123_02585 [Lachnospiraceae bacterium]|nr:hypothetical protein [Lachnospiraceae bacterium]